jgi:hypothetical protein
MPRTSVMRWGGNWYLGAFLHVHRGGVTRWAAGDTSDEMVIAVAAVTVGYNDVPSDAPPTIHGYMG